VERKKKHSAYAKLACPRRSITNEAGNAPNDTGILVRENTKTVKVDNTYCTKLRSRKHSHKSNSDNTLLGRHQRAALKERTSSAEVVKSEQKVCERANSADAVLRDAGIDKSGTCYSDEKSELYAGENFARGSYGVLDASKSRYDDTKCSSNPQLKCGATPPSARNASSGFSQERSDSIVSTCSAISECHSTFSASDIMLNMQFGLSRENSIKRPKSAPGTFVRTASSGSLPNMVVNNFIASSSDNFRSHGAWRYIIEYRGKWESKCIFHKTC